MCITSKMRALLRPRSFLSAVFTAVLVIALSATTTSQPARAQIVCANCSLWVTQIEEFARQLMQYAKQIQQYELQIEQYQNMVKNTRSIPRAFFDQALQGIRNVEVTLRQGTNVLYTMRNLDTEFRRLYPEFRSVFDSVEYLDRATSMNNYARRSAEAYDLARTALLAARDHSDGLLDEQQLLDSIGYQVTGADGNLDALQAAGQYAQHSAQQLMKMRQIALMQVQLLADHQANAQREADLRRAQLDHWVTERPADAQRTGNSSTDYVR